MFIINEQIIWRLRWTIKWNKRQHLSVHVCATSLCLQIWLKLSMTKLSSGPQIPVKEIGEKILCPVKEIGNKISVCIVNQRRHQNPDYREWIDHWQFYSLNTLSII